MLSIDVALTRARTKFNVINHSIVHSTETKVPTITCGVLAVRATPGRSV